MTNQLRFDGRVAIITGSGNGLGRSHALLLASRGAKVVVNDLGGGIHGEGRGSEAADKVVKEIEALGGKAVADYHSVEDGAAIVKTAIDAFGRIDIVVNNAGILRDVSFHKMTEQDWELVYKVHVLGAFRVTHAAWPYLRDQQYGRVIVTSSAAGIYGNFGQANYSMAKSGLVGFAKTLATEGRQKNVHVNAIAPIAGSRMTETVLPKELLDALKPEHVSPLVAYLCHESCKETGGLYELGGGFFSKLRVERSEGVTFRLGRTVTPEALADSWDKIAGFEHANHPADITSSMAPVLKNVEAGPGKGGNEHIDVDLALGHEMPEVESSYDERDLSLYALAVGGATDPTDDKDLQLVYELHSDGFKALPTYAVIPAINAFLGLAKQGVRVPGFNFGLERILHGEQITELKRPLPPKAKLKHKLRVKNVYDKGKNAVIDIEIRSTDESGEELMVNNLIAVVRGAGGWGGDRGPSSEEVPLPDRAPDAVITEKTNANQALLYRLCGDWNPLHVDPGFAKAFGFDKPILHGLCTFGYGARHVIKSFANGDPRTFKNIKARMANTVFPGETLVTEMWKESPLKIVFRMKVKERDVPVLTNATIELYPEIPTAKRVEKKAAAKVEAAAPQSLEPTSDDIFAAIGKYIQKDPSVVGRVATVFQFDLKNPDKTWTVDLKNGGGSVTQAPAGKSDCTLALTDQDFLGMCTGKLDAQKLFTTGKLKISGNVMASMKLDFLRKMDPQLVLDALRERLGAAPAAAPATPPPQADAPEKLEPTTGDIFAAIGKFIEKDPGVVGRVATVYQFDLKNPDSTWTVDLKNGGGSVTSAPAPKADCTLALTDQDFLGMCTGKLDSQKLFTTGKLKISGNIMASMKLEFLKKLDPQLVLDAMRARAGGGAAPQAATAAAPASPGKDAAAKPSQAPKILEKLEARLKEKPSALKEIGAVIQLRLKEPDAEYVLDLREGKGGITAGAAPKPDAVLTLEQADLVELARGEKTPQVLHQHGKLRIDGDMRVARHLGVFGGLL